MLEGTQTAREDALSYCFLQGQEGKDGVTITTTGNSWKYSQLLPLSKPIIISSALYQVTSKA